jgi:hypothetical protein
MLEPLLEANGLQNSLRDGTGQLPRVLAQQCFFAPEWPSAQLARSVRWAIERAEITAFAGSGQGGPIGPAMVEQ